jgi:hypothetical protein
MKQAFRKFISLTATLLLVVSVYAQVTTGGVSGVVRDGRGVTLPGTTVKVTHVPSGTVYYTITQSNGSYSITGIRVGSDYSLEFSFIGFNTSKVDGVVVTLGSPIRIDATLREEAVTFGEVVIVGELRSAFSKERTGAATNISGKEMASMPTINRGLSDYTKLSPYSTGGNSFGGRDGYMTNVTVDGANFNNNFGLSSTGMPGVSGDPISMDAIEEMQVVIAPFDVRQSNFTGAGINAVTKSGTNVFRGSAYGYYRNQDLAGKKIYDRELNVTESSRRTLGFSLGGPIIKNKLFFFVNGEMDNNLTPGNTMLARRTPADNNSSDGINNTVQAADLEKFSNLLRTAYGYETGRYENWGGDDESNYKLMARLDWNISNAHKFTFRYNYAQASSVSRPSNSGDANPSIDGTRHGEQGGISFENSQYFLESALHSITAELHSQFSHKLSNDFLVAYTNYNQPRTSNSSVFPMIDIMRGAEGDRNPYMTAGYELFSYMNEVQNNTFIITNNLTFSTGKHIVTGGLSYENQYFANSYLRQGSSYYRFKDLDSFERFVNGNGVGQPWNSDYHPLNFAYTYPINGFTNPAAELSFGQFSAYVQDEFSVMDNLKITGGLRIDLPMYLDGAIDNPDTHGVQFKNGERVDLSSWPKTQVLFSPRLGFNWDVFRDKSLTIRGGTGIFTGRIPFVWFTNQPTNSGMLQYQLVINQNGGAASRDQLARLPLYNDASQLLANSSLNDIFPTSNAPGRISAIDKEFKLPQVWRTSIAADIKLPLNMMLTLEGIYSKDINTVTFENINLQNPTGVLKEGDMERDYYTGGTQRVTTTFTEAIIMRNTNKGQSFSFAAELTLPRMYGFSGTLAYAYNYAEEITGKNGSDPYSAWRYRQTVNSLNSQEIGLTMNNTPNRFIASINYHVDYAKYFGTTVSLFYSGSTGSSYSYTYSGSPMNDGGVATNLMYIPKSESDVIWVNGTADWNRYLEFASQDKYLKNNMGKYMNRYGAYLPWSDRFDLKFAQDFKFNTNGKVKHNLQFTMDIINLANLLSSKWGINKVFNGSNKAYQLLRYQGIDAATGKARVSVNQNTNTGDYFTNPVIVPSSISSTWAIQFGLRYSF